MTNENNIPWCCRPANLCPSLVNKMINRDKFPHDRWCLTCNKPQNVLKIYFYGSWNYCHCPGDWNKTVSLANKGTTRRPTMKWTVNAELILQESDVKVKTELVAAFMNFEVTADDFDGALKIAKELLEGKTEGSNITGIGLSLAE